MGRGWGRVWGRGKEGAEAGRHAHYRDTIKKAARKALAGGAHEGATILPELLLVAEQLREFLQKLHEQKLLLNDAGYVEATTTTPQAMHADLRPNQCCIASLNVILVLIR